MQDQRYFWPGLSGPPFRRVVDSGIKVGAGTDSTGLCPLTPWASMYFMVTGLNGGGVQVNPGQQITRLEALRLYTIGSAWFSFDDGQIGSLEIGKLADLVVLSDDYLTIPQADIRSITSLLTLLGGRGSHPVAAMPETTPSKSDKRYAHRYR